MKLTSQQEFGLRCLLRLAREEGPLVVGSANTLPVNRIAEDEGLSTEYAGKLMGVLTRCGLVESVRGRNGGYRLARPAAQISLAESLAALGGKLFDGETCERFRGDRHFCIHTGACTIRSVWTGLQFVLDQVLTRTTLRDMVDHSEEGMTEWVQRHVAALVESANQAPPSRPGLPRTVRHDGEPGVPEPVDRPGDATGRGSAAAFHLEPRDPGLS